MTGKEQKAAAEQFVKEWQQRPGDEDQETQQFWTQLLREVYGVKHPEAFISFEKKVKSQDGKSVKKIDAYLAETRVIIEQKSRSKDLGKVQGGGYGDITPYEQARFYNELLGLKEKAHWIVTCNFSEFRIHDMSKDTEPERREPVAIIPLADLPKRYADLSFFVDCSVNEIAREQEEVSAKATLEVAKLYNALLQEYEDPNNPETLKHLNRLCVRLVFCYYAEDAGIFDPNQFTHYLADYKDDPDDVRENLLKAFGVMDTPVELRDKYMKRKLMDFPYVNGGLFANAAETEVPRFNDKIVDMLIKAGEELDWSMISPTIFGAMFESTLNPETRRSGGMHYTSIENIHKVIDPLFLDDLKDEFRHITKGNHSSHGRQKALDDFQAKLSSLTFLDPACGSGNFLTETYLSLRELENEVIAAQFSLSTNEQLLALDVIQVSISQFYGIEINDFAVAVAKTALWIAESQMLDKTKRIVYGLKGEVLPLKAYNNIVEANALRIDWESAVPRDRLSYIIGNPPFLGHQWRSKSQVEDMDIVFSGWGKYGKLDYVACWFVKAADYAKDAPIRAAFVATNSLTQGEQVAAMWKPLFEKGFHIDFAHRTFKWDNEAKDKAAVHCVIIGFSKIGEGPRLLIENGRSIQVKNINGYLAAAPSVFIQNRSKPLNSLMPKMSKGSQPTDGGNLLLSEQERSELVAAYPQTAAFIREYLTSRSFINGGREYCLWLKDVSPRLYRDIPPIAERLAHVAEMRSSSPTASVRRDAATPMLFTQIRQPDGDYLAVPEVSSERRRYIPIGYLSSDVIASNKLYLIRAKSPYIFALLTSSVHMTWMRTVAGRLKSDYSYSPAVYSTFPWPEADEAQQVRICELGQDILKARESSEESTLADLYDPLFMPPELLKAHQNLDKAVLKLYGLRANATEADILAELFRRYQVLVEKKDAETKP